MPPQQPNGTAPSQTGPEQYDFIVNYDKQRQSNRLIKVNNSSLKNRLLITGGGALLLIVCAWIFIAFLSTSSHNPTAPLITLTQQQTELARVALEAEQNASIQPTKNFATTTNLSLLSEQHTFIAFLHGLGSSPSSTVLQALQNKQTDSTLQSALTAGTYDQTYISIAQDELNSYESALKLAFANTKNSKEQALLSTAYSQAQLLVQQSSQTE